MVINKDLLKNQYLDFFVEEHKYVKDKISKFTSNGTIHNRNKLKHLQDRLDSAAKVISGDFDIEDLVAQELYSAIWGSGTYIDKFVEFRADTESALNKITREIDNTELKHLTEYAKSELKYLVDIIVNNDPNFYLLTNNIKVGN